MASCINIANDVQRNHCSEHDSGNLHDSIPDLSAPKPGGSLKVDSPVI